MFIQGLYSHRAISWAYRIPFVAKFRSGKWFKGFEPFGGLSQRRAKNRSVRSFSRSQFSSKEVGALAELHYAFIPQYVYKGSRFSGKLYGNSDVMNQIRLSSSLSDTWILRLSDPFQRTVNRWQMTLFPSNLATRVWTFPKKRMFLTLRWRTM